MAAILKMAEPNQTAISVMYQEHRRGRKKTFSQNCYSTISKSSSGRVQAEAIGWRAEMQNNGGDSLPGDHGGGEEV